MKSRDFFLYSKFHEFFVKAIDSYHVAEVLSHGLKIGGKKSTNKYNFYGKTLSKRKKFVKLTFEFQNSKKFVKITHFGVQWISSLGKNVCNFIAPKIP